MGTFSVVIGLIIVGMLILKLDAHTLLLGVLLISGLSAFSLGYSYDEIMKIIVAGISRSLEALFIFLLIGAVVGAWMISGTVPTLIHYGLELINPVWFLPSGLILCSIMSIACGTSWGTVGTLGVALSGIGYSLGIPLPIVAGMVISGACFGDKMSPISETTNLAPVAAGTDIYTHIKAMALSTTPTYIICLIFFTVMGFKYGGTQPDLEYIALIQKTLNASFTITPLVLFPIVVTLTLSFMRFPALFAMIMGVLTGGLVAIFIQGVPLAETFNAINYGYSNDTGVALVNKLLNRGGIQGMMWTFSFTIIIMAVGALLDGIGILGVMVEKLTRGIRRPASLVAATIATTGATCMATGDSYTAMILSGNFFGKAYDDAGMDRSMLSRCCEEGGTLLTPLVPWSPAAAFMGGALGVSCMEYLPYTMLNWLNPLLSIGLAYMGIFIIKKKKTDIDLSRVVI